MQTDQALVALLSLYFLLPLAAAGSTVVFVAGDDSNLCTINAPTGATTLIGPLGIEMSDIAARNGLMYGISFPPSGPSRLYSINEQTAAATPIGASLDAFLNGLQFGPDGTLYASGGDSLYRVNTSTGVASLIGSGTGAGMYNSSGDLEFVGNTMYLTSLLSMATDQLFTIDPTTGQGTLIGNIGYPSVYGLADPNGVIYGFNTVGNHVLSISLVTGAATPVSTYSAAFHILGAAEDSSRVAAALEPGTLGAMALGLALVAKLATKRRRQSL
jgi:hypothetical protein